MDSGGVVGIGAGRQEVYRNRVQALRRVAQLLGKGRGGGKAGRGADDHRAGLRRPGEHPLRIRCLP